MVGSIRLEFLNVFLICLLLVSEVKQSGKPTSVVCFEDHWKRFWVSFQQLGQGDELFAQAQVEW